MTSNKNHRDKIDQIETIRNLNHSNNFDDVKYGLGTSGMLLGGDLISSSTKLAIDQVYNHYYPSNHIKHISYSYCIRPFSNK